MINEEKFEAFIHLKDFLCGYSARDVSLDEEICEEAIEQFGVAKVKKAIATWNMAIADGEKNAIEMIRKLLKIDE